MTTFEYYKAAVDAMPITTALWWFIENINSEDESRTEWFFYLRARYRTEAPSTGSEA